MNRLQTLIQKKSQVSESKTGKKKKKDHACICLFTIRTSTKNGEFAPGI